ncbi:glycoside hydrolase family 130 protein [Pedobacter sp. AW1-32]|uniref:glycoside hydrolase family 130 protein n=1 Tax=Pedobacter sp. AW1-32 TaxID=3383026 RepID=UPI003FED8D47
MRLYIERKSVKVFPDTKRVIARFFFNGEERALAVIKKVLEFPEEKVFALVSPILQEYSKRHRNITKILNRHCKKLRKQFTTLNVDFEDIEPYTKLLIGAYFTHEYSIESAAFFNPSIVDDPDQTDLVDGEKRVIISFRAVGEGHISSIVFRRALIDSKNNIQVLPVGNYVDEAEVVKNAIYIKKLFLKKAAYALIDPSVLQEIEEKLDERFEYTSLSNIIKDSKTLHKDNAQRLIEYDKVLWLSDTYHTISFSKDTDISDRVIFPISEFERKGIEDARFVKFIKENGKVVYYATYTAFDGSLIIPKLVQTEDFYEFKVIPLYGDGAQNKNLALFPRKINGKYVMMSRIDGWNNYLMFSDKVNIWENPILLKQPKYDWELVQIGNCGSPIETEKGWLVMTHGVGPMRRYCIGVVLLDLEDPSKEIGHLKEPLIIPTGDEREGYVPNVVYSCGSIISNGELIIPYGLSDYSSSFATVNLELLLNRLLENGSAM